MAENYKGQMLSICTCHTCTLAPYIHVPAMHSRLTQTHEFKNHTGASVKFELNCTCMCILIILCTIPL